MRCCSEAGGSFPRNRAPVQRTPNRTQLQTPPPIATQYAFDPHASFPRHTVRRTGIWVGGAPQRHFGHVCGKHTRRTRRSKRWPRATVRGIDSLAHPSILFCCLRLNSCVCRGDIVPGAGVRGIRTYVAAAGGALEVENQADIALVEDVLHHNHLSWDGWGRRRNDVFWLSLGIWCLLLGALGITPRVSHVLDITETVNALANWRCNNHNDNAWCPREI